MNNYTYTITAINQDGSISYVCSVDNKVQNISNAPINDTQALKQFCDDYTTAYVAGIKQEQADNAAPVVDPTINALLNQPQTVTPQAS